MNIKKILENKNPLIFLEKIQDLRVAESDTKNSTMKTFYKNFIINEMFSSGCYKNIMQIPKILKVVLNVGFNADKKNDVDYVFNKLKSITGQLPRLNKAKKSVSNFKIREGDIVGCMVTLRSERMYNFLEKLLFIHLSRMQNFMGFSNKSFDGLGNFSFGIEKHSVFLESKDYRADFDFGMDVTIVTSALKDDDAFVLLNLFGFPFKN